MTDQLSRPLSWKFGYYPTSANSGQDRVVDSIRDGRNMWFLGPGLMQSAKGPAVSGELGNEILSLVGSKLGSIQTGSIYPYRGGTIFFIGSGTVRYDGTSLGTATSSLQFVSGSPFGSPQTVGLIAPSAPTVAAGASGINSGSYSVVLTRIRSVLGSESNGSLPSAVISVANKKIAITFPAAVGNDRWRIYATFRGRGSVGPHLILEEVDESVVAAAGRVLERDWNDSQLGSEQPPTDFNVPPEGTHGAALGANNIVLGTFKGTGSGIAAGVSPSIGNKIEAFPASATSFLNPYESIVGLVQRPTDGELMIATENSLQALVLTGSSSFPVFTRAIWPTTGFQGKHAFCFAESTIYGYSGKAGPVRLGGAEPDVEFALPVYEQMRKENWDPATVVVGYDRERDAVIYMGNGTNGNLAFPFMRSLGIWSVPIAMPGVVQSAVTIKGQLKISIGGAIYNFETGSGGDWNIKPAWQDWPNTFYKKTIIGYSAQLDTASASVTIDFLKNFSETPVGGCSQTTSGSGERFTKWKEINQYCRVYGCNIRGSGAGHRVNAFQFDMLYEPGVREN